MSSPACNLSSTTHATLLPLLRAISRVIFLVFSPIAIGIGLFYAYSFDPLMNSSRYLPCQFLSMTGYFCPGCGGTRALHALLHFHFLKALDYNCILPFVLAILIYVYLGVYLYLLMGRPVLWEPKTIQYRWLILAGAIFILFAVLRNIDIYPFVVLAP